MSDLRAPFPWFGSLPLNIQSKIGTVTPSGCVPWMAAKTNGYGVVQHCGKVQRAHRIIYEVAKGWIPTGFEVDHLCRNRGCVNPEHLEAVPQPVNNMRSLSASALHARQSHCKRGHPLDGENVYLRKRGHKVERFCRACNRLRDNERYRRRKPVMEVDSCTN